MLQKSTRSSMRSDDLNWRDKMAAKQDSEKLSSPSSSIGLGDDTTMLYMALLNTIFF